MIYHVVPLDDWLLAPDRPYAPASLAEEGFVHCSPDEPTALAVADERFRDTVGPLMVLIVDEAELTARIRWEDAADGRTYPHVYGRINRTAVTGMLEVERDAEGRARSLAAWS
ncbi:hypothetical protein SRB5_32970 [Streptomyces sp. RB5]|uniref:DUF952 domain-containing protein n=1 Tax=Streptomyces smaragdinus TaxID=2585196 RepID=A0A7K0CK56_9ACTN|nr:DUF952 domain-containing protein [Streptomyces smaragdinus]MQY13154.1 hypothetical protein [Streptomyces smaragdinus]